MKKLVIFIMLLTFAACETKTETDIKPEPQMASTSTIYRDTVKSLFKSYAVSLEYGIENVIVFDFQDLKDSGQKIWGFKVSVVPDGTSTEIKSNSRVSGSVCAGNACAYQASQYAAQWFFDTYEPNSWNPMFFPNYSRYAVMKITNVSGNKKKITGNLSYQYGVTSY